MCSQTEKCGRGTIMRIYVENFVTYDNAEICPGSGLNVIIGPNGTGKSTIASAIVLGLGGRPNVIGRGETVSTYVKSGREKAKIVIELKDKGSKNVTIAREFNLQNESLWTLNGKPAKFKEIKGVIDDFKIQVDNLCQLLPQDKVQDFAKMNAQQLLENTERSVGDPQLIEFHNELKKYRKKDIEVTALITDREGLLQTETQKCDEAKEAVSHVKERKAITKRIKSLTQKKAWIRYDMARKHLADSKVERDSVAGEMKKYDTSINALEKNMKGFKAKFQNLETNARKYESTFIEKVTRMNQSLENVKKCDQQLKDIELDHQSAIEKEETRDEEIRGAQQQISLFENDLKVAFKEIGPESQLNFALRQVSEKIEKERRAYDKLVSLKNDARTEENYINNQIRYTQNEINELNDVDSKRLKLLQSRNPDVFKAVMWLRQNQHQFSSKVWEPMMLNINVKSEHNTKYVENVIPYRDMLAFVCEDKKDMNRLIQLVREEQRLKINVVHSDASNDLRANVTENVPLGELKQYGFLDYLINLFEAPTTIMNYLISNYNVHNIPVGTKAVDDNYENLPKGLRLFFSQDVMYAVSRSRYTGQKSFRSSAINSNKMLSVMLDTNKLRQLNEDIKSFDQKKAKVMEKLNNLESEAKEMSDELEESRKKKNKVVKDMHQIENYKTRIKLATDKIQKLENERMPVEEIKAATADKMKQVHEKQLKVYRSYVEQMSQCLKFVSENHQMSHKLLKFRKQYAAKEYELKSLRDQMILTERRFRTLDECLRPLKEETQSLYAAALETTDQICPRDNEFAKLQAIFAKLPATIPEIDRELVDAKAKVYFMGNDAEVAKVLRDYEKSSATVKKLTESLEDLKVEKNLVDSKLAELKPKWFPELNKLITQINENFRSYFQTIECVGEVALSIPDCEDDYEAYGLQIRVKFRDNEQIRELSRQHHSGGERAVTTAAYMIALQELSIVPFRCVDEINQGMDSTNERRIFELIVKITGQENSCQYFFLTPKLLPGVNYGDKVTILCVYNGPFMIPSSRFNVEQYCQKICAS